MPGRRPPRALNNGARGHGRPTRGREPSGLGGEQVEGRHAVHELLVAGRRAVREVLIARDGADNALLEEIAELARDNGARVVLTGRDALLSRARSDAPQGMIAFADPLLSLDLETLVARASPAFLVVLDGVTDPHNLGAILRSASGAGATGVVLRAPRAVAVTPVVAKAAAGAIEHLHFSLVAGIPNALLDLRRAGVWSVGLDAAAPRDLEDVEVLDRDVALVLGDEGEGLSNLVRERCEVLASIPLYGPLESLNVAAAAAIATFTVARKRRRAE
jgi:23S rRNA (guanosine2251-2'-O)-methyltransferase